jgi:hypothetical protein
MHSFRRFEVTSVYFYQDARRHIPEDSAVLIKLFSSIGTKFFVKNILPVLKHTVAARSKAWTAFARSKTGILGSNPTWGMDVCVCVYSVFVLSCVQVTALILADPPSKETYRLCKRWRNWKSRQAGLKQISFVSSRSSLTSRVIVGLRAFAFICLKKDWRTKILKWLISCGITPSKNVPI